MNYASDIKRGETSVFSQKNNSSCILMSVWPISVHIFFKSSISTLDRRQSKTLILSINVDKISGNRVFYWHLSPIWQQMTFKTPFLVIFDSRF